MLFRSLPPDHLMIGEERMTSIEAVEGMDEGIRDGETDLREVARQLMMFIPTFKGAVPRKLL